MATTASTAAGDVHGLDTAEFQGDDGGLDLVFTDGSRVRVDPDDAYEAWSFRGGGHPALLSGPGGEI